MVPVSNRFGALHLDRARRDAVHANPPLPQFLSVHLGKHLHAAFAGGAVHQVTKRQLVAPGANVDYRAAVCLRPPARLLRTQKAAFEIARKHAVPVLFMQFKQRLPGLKASIADQNFQSPEGFMRLVKHPAYLTALRDVACKCRSLPPHLDDFIDSVARPASSSK